MTKTTYKRKPFIGASVQFHGERGNSQAGMVQEQLLRAYMFRKKQPTTKRERSN